MYSYKMIKPLDKLSFSFTIKWPVINIQFRDERLFEMVC